MLVNTKVIWAFILESRLFFGILTKSRHTYEEEEQEDAPPHTLLQKIKMGSFKTRFITIDLIKNYLTKNCNFEWTN